MKQKVLAYIFRHNGDQKELLVFDHVAYPEVSPQVIGGTVDQSESPEAAVIREIFEESGVSLALQGKIGEFEYYREDIDELQLRHVFSFETNGLKDSWTHVVSAGVEDSGLEFYFYWLPLEIAKKTLVGNMGDYLNER